MKSNLKVTWIGEGNPPSGIYEYGAGTSNPTIPRGILARRETTTNWSFEYVYAGSQSEMAEYLQTPVWVYRKTNDLSGLSSEEGKYVLPDKDEKGREKGKLEAVDESKLYFAMSPEDIPANADDVEKGTIGDLYLFYYGDHPEEKKSLDGKSVVNAKEHKKRKREGAALKEKRAIITWDSSGNVTLTDDENGSSIVGLYAMARATGADTLAESILEFSYGVDNKLTFNSYDMFDDEDFASFYGNKKFGWMCMSSLGAESIADIKDTMQDYYHTYMEESSAESQLPEAIRTTPEEEWHKEAQSLPAPSRPTMAVESLDNTTNEIDTPDVYDILASHKKVMEERMDKLKVNPIDIPVGTRLSKEVSTEGASSGRLYFLGASDSLVESVIMSMPTHLQSVIHAMFDEKDNMRYGQLRSPDPEVVKNIIKENSAAFGGVKRPNAQNVADVVALALVTFNQRLGEQSPELTLSGVPGEFPGIISKNFPFLAEAGTRAEGFMGLLASGLRKGVEKALTLQAGGRSVVTKNILKQLQENPESNLNLSHDAMTPMVNSGMSYMEDTDEFLYVASQIATDSGKTLEEVKGQLARYIRQNFSNTKALKNLESNSAVLIKGEGEAKILSDVTYISGVGVVLGMLSAMNDNTKEMAASIASEGFSEFVSSIFGDNITFDSDDWFTYKDSEGTDFRISLGMLHYMAPGLPFSMRDGELMIRRNGEDVAFRKQSADTQTEIRDEIARSIMTDALTGMSSDEFLGNYMRKYQDGLINSGEIDRNDRIEINSMSGDDDEMHFSPEEMKNIDNRVYGAALTAQAYMKDLGAMMTDKKLNLTEDDVREILLERENAIDSMKEEITATFGVPEQHKEVIWEALKDALKQSREGMVKDILTRNVKTNLARNLEALSMIPLMCNIAAKAEDFSLDRGITGYFSHDMDMSGLVDEKPEDLTFSGFSINVNGEKHYIAKENRGAGFGDVLHLRNKNDELLASTFEIKAAQDSSQKSHVSAVTPWMNSLVKLAKGKKGIKLSKLRDMNIIYGSDSNDTKNSKSTKKDGSARQVRGSSQGSMMQRHSRYSKRRIGIPSSSFDRAVEWDHKKEEATKFHSTPVVNINQVLELQSSEGRGFASF